MIRAERAERLIFDKKTAYETGGFEGGALWHWLDTVQGVADGCQTSEVNVPGTCLEELEDTVVLDVSLGVRLGRTMCPEDQVFFTTVDDADGRHVYFFFTAPSEDVVIERLLAAFGKDEMRPEAGQPLDRADAEWREERRREIAEEIGDELRGERETEWRERSE